MVTRPTKERLEEIRDVNHCMRCDGDEVRFKDVFLSPFLIDELVLAIDALEAEREKLQFKYDTVRKMADERVSELEKEIERMQTQIQFSSQKRAELEKERDEYKRQIAAHECRFTSLDHQSLSETIEKLRAALKFSEAALDAVAVQTKGLVSKIARDAANEAREVLK